MRWLILLFLASFFFSCSKRTLKHLERSGVSVSNSQDLIFGKADNKIDIQYLGCGGLFIKSANQSIIIDPYFSHQSFMRIGRSIFLNGKIKPSMKQLNFGKQMIQDSLELTEETLVSQVKGIFSAHGHYDHVMDIPYIHQVWLNAEPEVYLNTSSCKTVATVIAADKLIDVEKIASVRNQVGQSVDFADGQNILRVYPIFADHNPHSRNIKLFAGSAVKTPSHLKNPLDKTFVTDWLEGQTLSFLVDFVKGDSILFRLFVQSSSCQFPEGLPPDELLKKKSVDLAVMGVASYQFSENSYPCEFLEKLQPKKLMFIHWEDFFSDYRGKVKAVRKNDIPRFFNEVFSSCKMDYLLPIPGSVISVRY